MDNKRLGELLGMNDTASVMRVSKEHPEFTQNWIKLQQLLGSEELPAAEAQQLRAVVSEMPKVLMLIREAILRWSGPSHGCPETHKCCVTKAAGQRAAACVRKLDIPPRGWFFMQRFTGKAACAEFYHGDNKKTSWIGWDTYVHSNIGTDPQYFCAGAPTYSLNRTATPARFDASDARAPGMAAGQARVQTGCSSVHQGEFHCCVSDNATACVRSAKRSFPSSKVCGAFAPQAPGAWRVADGQRTCLGADEHDVGGGKVRAAMRSEAKAALEATVRRDLDGISKAIAATRRKVVLQTSLTRFCKWVTQMGRALVNSFEKK